MMAVTHVAAGAAFAQLLAELANARVEQTGLLLAGGTLGSLLPDIDHPKSTLGRCILPVSMAIATIFGHRGITHSLLAAVAAAISAWYALVSLDWHPAYTVPIVLGVSAGYLSHLACDYFTNTGIPLFWPLRMHVRAPFAIHTGSAAEYMIALVIWLWLILKVL